MYLNEIGASRRLLRLAIGLEGLSELPIYYTGAAILRTLGPRWTLVLSFTVYALRAFLHSIMTTPELAASASSQPPILPLLSLLFEVMG